jgi:hypothetical protein
MVDLDIDIWGYGRDAAAAGLFTTASLKAAYPYVEVPDVWLYPWGKLNTMLDEHFPLNHNDQRVFKTWIQQRPGYVFFQNREDAEFCRGLFYII